MKNKKKNSSKSDILRNKWQVSIDGIILFVLLENVTFIIQLFDVRIFSASSNRREYQWYMIFTKDGLSRLITKGTFLHVFKMAWEAITRSSEKAIQIASNAFQWSSIFHLFRQLSITHWLVTSINFC